MFQIEFIDLDTSKIGRVKLGVQQRIESTFRDYIAFSYLNRSGLREIASDCSICR